MDQPSLFDPVDGLYEPKKPVPEDVLHTYDLKCRIHDEITYAVNEISSESADTASEEMAQEMLLRIVGRLEDVGLGDPRRRDNYDRSSLRKR